VTGHKKRRGRVQDAPNAGGTEVTVEERRYSRTPVKVPVEFSRLDANQVTSGFIMDLSIGGAFVTTTFPLPFGSEVALRTSRSTGDRDDAVLHGVVRWTRSHGMGVQFFAVGGRARKVIHDIVVTRRVEDDDCQRVACSDAGDRPTRPD
jgi:PilZ domain-containing protein